jgi:hypothetical protein
MYKNVITNIRSKNISNLSNTLLLCHSGNNYKVIEKLASFGSNICVMEHLPNKKTPQTKTFMVAENICEKMKRPCITVLQCDMYNPKYMDYAINETKDIYGSIDGLVLYNKNKWECGEIIYKYLYSIKTNGNISIMDPDLL